MITQWSVWLFGNLLRKIMAFVTMARSCAEDQVTMFYETLFFEVDCFFEKENVADSAA